MNEEAPLSPEDEGQAAYIADLVGGLSLIARRHRLDTLRYLLDMAKLEAESVKVRGNGSAQ
jgi:hypothetical protein